MSNSEGSRICDIKTFSRIAEFKTSFYIIYEHSTKRKEVELEGGLYSSRLLMWVCFSTALAISHALIMYTITVPCWCKRKVKIAIAEHMGRSSSKTVGGELRWCGSSWKGMYNISYVDLHSVLAMFLLTSCRIECGVHCSGNIDFQNFQSLSVLNLFANLIVSLTCIWFPFTYNSSLYFCTDFAIWGWSWFV